MNETVVNKFVNKERLSEEKSKVWALLLGDLKKLFSEDVYLNWFEDLLPQKWDQEKLTLLAPNEFAAIWIRNNYKSIIEKKLATRTGKNYLIELEFPPENGNRKIEEKVEPILSKNEIKRLNAIKKFDDTQAANPNHTFENFVIGPGNQLAHATCVAISKKPGKAYNPLFLYGATGLGKTHLMQAVAHESLSNKPSLKIVYTSTEKFTNEFIRAIQENSLSKFRQNYRKVDMLLIDDIHFLSGKERIQEEFFYTFNELFESQKQIFLCSDRPASEIAKLEDRLISRFQWGFVADIQAPDLETRIAILRKKALARHLELPAEVLQLLAKGVCTNVRRLEGALNRVAGYIALMNRQIDAQEAQHLLADVFKEETKKIVSIEQIQRCVAEYYKITLADLLGKKRPASIAYPRQVAMYLSRLLTSHSLQRIGSEFGGRDHGTVIHACKTVENTIEQDPKAKRDISQIQSSLEA